jgi:hypothetical protein
MRLLRSLSLGVVCTIISIHPALGKAEEPLRLREALPAGYVYHVSSRVELAGSLALGSEKTGPQAKALSVKGTSAIEYDERVLESEAKGLVPKTIRIYRRIEFQRIVGERTQDSTIRPQVRRQVILRHKNTEVPFSPDGPLTWGEIDLVRTDVFTPALTGLLPEGAVPVGGRWTAANTAVQELTDMEHIDTGQVECRLEQITVLAGRRHARVGFAGAVRGVNEDGPNQQQIDGYFFFDLESNHLSYLSLHGISSLLDKDGKPQGSIEGRFVLTRQVHSQVQDLTDEALKGVTLEPNNENTRLLYENPELGIRFLHSRRWHLAGVHGAQVALDEANGNGLMFTLEPRERVPAAPQFVAESRGFFENQKAKILRVDEPRRVQSAPQEMDHFALDIEVSGQRTLMDYYILRQAAGGATLAARLLPADLSALQKEVAEIARSAVISRPLRPGK